VSLAIAVFAVYQSDATQETPSSQNTSLIGPFPLHWFSTMLAIGAVGDVAVVTLFAITLSLVVRNRARLSWLPVIGLVVAIYVLAPGFALLFLKR
jgi:hypothetical protein